MDDYISRETSGDDYVRRADIIEKFMDRLPSISVNYLCKIADEVPPADVIPRATIEENIENVISFLNSINIDGRFDYPTYSALHDAITGILPEKEADSDG